MTEDFDSAVQKVAREKNGDAVTPQLFWDITVALGKDLKAVDAAGKARHEETLDLLSAHVKENTARADGLAVDLHNYQHDQADECAKKHQELFGRLPRRSSDPPDADYTSEFAAAEVSRRKYSRESLVASFWILVGLLILSGVVNGLVDLLFR